MTLKISPIQIPPTTRFADAKPENMGDEPHQQIEKLLTPQTHRDGLAEQGFSLGKMSDQLGNILYQDTHDLETGLGTFLQEEKKGYLTLVSVDEKDHLSSAVTIKTEKNGEITFKQSTLNPGGVLSETRTGSLNNATDKHDLLRTLSSDRFEVLSEVKTDFQHVDNDIQPGSTEHPAVSPKKSILKRQQTGAEQPSHASEKVKKTVGFSPDTVTFSETGTDRPYVCIERKDQKVVGAINTKNENMTFDNCEIFHKSGANEKKPVLKTDSGDLNVRNDSFVLGNLASSTGNITIDNARTSKHIINLSGKTQLHNMSLCSGTLYTDTGKIEVSLSSAGGIINKHGETLLSMATIRNNVDAGTGTLAIHSSVIHKDVNSGSCAFAISSSKVKGTLTAQSDNLRIGNKCEINNLVIKKEDPSGESSVQNITLGAGTTLNTIAFDADVCFLTLEKNASYTGPLIPGLEITRVP
ncbi:hypothetical protein [Pantoea cypripedii]|uniref:Uncharacterized protein n=1 Tax=Pantoea cypripedii TaxID=55209 RepID=A0A6B9G8J3_PANCY|nr:hypothetical protein [Pantoea cypripedii]QGY32143.1 hypothetical protein CUN67_24430 [Pantoea cypripedii]